MNTPIESLLTEAELVACIRERTGEGSIRTLRKWRTRRIGPAWVKVGRRIVYPLSGIEPWLESITQQPLRSRRAA
jgi:hypothetical protein